VQESARVRRTSAMSPNPRTKSPARRRWPGVPLAARFCKRPHLPLGARSHCRYGRGLAAHALTRHHDGDAVGNG